MDKKFKKYLAMLVLALLGINVVGGIVGNFFALAIPDWWNWIIGIITFGVIVGLAYDKNKLKMSGKVSTTLLLTGIFLIVGWTLLGSAFTSIGLSFLWVALAPSVYGFLGALAVYSLVSALQTAL